MDRLYIPVVANHQPDAMVRWVSGWLFDGEDGRSAAARMDNTLARLPGFSDARLPGNWISRKLCA